MARTQGEPEPPPRLEDLLGAGIPRDRAVKGVQIGTFRFEKGWTRYTLGKEAKMSGTNWKRVELGRVSPRIESLLHLAQVLGLVSVEQFFGRFPSDKVGDE